VVAGLPSSTLVIDGLWRGAMGRVRPRLIVPPPAIPFASIKIPTASATLSFLPQSYLTLADHLPLLELVACRAVLLCPPAACPREPPCRRF
jgi:hypothetical protein